MAGLKTNKQTNVKKSCSGINETENVFATIINSVANWHVSDPERSKYSNPHKWTRNQLQAFHIWLTIFRVIKFN